MEPSSEDEDDVPLSQRLRRRKAVKQGQKVSWEILVGRLKRKTRKSRLKNTR